MTLIAFLPILWELSEKVTELPWVGPVRHSLIYVAILFALVNLVKATHKKGRPLIYLVLLAATWVLGFFNALVHAKDAWASMPSGLILSVIVTILACAATWIGFTNLRAGGEA